ncbi:hypothetical protein N9N28_01005 [Rubripirellula amarantea]|uniref:Amino acid kinase family protein n=1 Tax=Rubripirellula amarantea TaxID=2527999 RepID=A0A5C5WFC4_9BACT|nr:hypothetical protein [Rubripirellula amarantea]MDA8743183.1 hypothetical protein [Rubripirellula amarantea]TWT49448.1 Amino acid kinase family protein [Rubripirellula amarantea]
MIRVVKVGGSLLLNPMLVDTLQDWIGCQEPATNVLIFGGGKVIDAIRELDTVHSLDPVATHWHCIDLLDAMFQVVSDWFPAWEAIRSPEMLQDLSEQNSAAATRLVRVGAFYRPGDDSRLPQDWRTTTDSIAAHLAIRLNADELVLLKSCDIPNEFTAASLAATGIVDAAFPLIAQHVARIRLERLQG